MQQEKPVCGTNTKTTIPETGRISESLSPSSFSSSSSSDLKIHSEKIVEVQGEESIALHCPW